MVFYGIQVHLDTNASVFQEAEDDYNVTWVFWYPRMSQHYVQEQSVWDHLRANYRLVQFGFQQQGQQTIPVFFLFRKGGTYNETKLNEYVQGKPILTKTYNSPRGQYQMGYINLE